MKSKHPEKLQDLYYEGAKLIESALNSMYNSVVSLCEDNREKMSNYSEETIKKEKKMDKIHDQIIDRLYSRESLVFSRKDRLFLINQMDEIVDSAEDVVRRISIYFPKEIPGELVPRLVAICERAKQIGTLLKNAIIAVFQDFNEASNYLLLIEKYRRESRKDDLTYLKKLYSLNLDTRDFFYFERLIHHIIITIDNANTFADGIHRLIVQYKL